MATQPYYSKSRATKAAKFTVFFRAISAPAALVGSILLVRLLDEEQYGVYNLFYAMLPAVVALMSFGLDNSIARYVPEFVKDGEFRLATRLHRTAQLIRFLSSTAIMLAMVIFWDTWSAWLNISDYRSAFTIFAALLLFHLQYSLLSTILASYLMQKYSVGARAGVAIFKATGYAVIWMRGGDLTTVLLLELAVFAIFTIALFSIELIKNDHSSGERSTMGPQSRRRIIRYAAFYNFNDIGTFTLGQKIDNFFISAFLSPIAVGAYSLATMISRTEGQFSPVNLFDTVIKPVFFSLDPVKESEDVTRYFQLLVKIALLFSIPVSAFLAAYHSSIVSVVFAGRFQDYSYLIVVVVCFALITRAGVMVSYVAQLAEKAGVVLASKIFVLYNVAALLWLIPRFGVLGAAIATGTAILFKEAFIWWHVRDLAGLRGMGRFFAVSLIFWLGFAMLSIIVQQVVKSPVVELALGMLIFSVSAFFYMRLELMSTREKEFLRENLPPKIVATLSRLAVII